MVIPNSTRWLFHHHAYTKIITTTKYTFNYIHNRKLKKINFRYKCYIQLDDELILFRDVDRYNPTVPVLRVE